MVLSMWGLPYVCHREKREKILEVERMNKMLMVNVKEKFAQARELCPGMSEEIYALTDHFADVANDCLYPSGILVALPLS